MIPWLHQWKATLLDTIFPRRCISCGVFDVTLCTRCASIHWNPRRTLSQESNALMQSALSLGAYNDPILREAMERFKFSGDQSLGMVFGTHLAAAIDHAFQEISRPHTPLILIPIPLHKKRIRERGFDQNFLLAQKVHLHSQVPTMLLHDAVSRTRYTTHQTHYSGKDRIHNVQGAFTLRHQSTSQIHNAHIVLIDDVITTGATAFAVAQEISAQCTPASIHIAAILCA